MSQSNERLQRLREMLAQVDPTGKASGLRESMENNSGVSFGTEAMEMPGGGVSTVATEANLVEESLDVLNRDTDIDADHQFALEAIIMPFHRPVVDIIDDKMSLPQLNQKWRHLGTDDAVRSRIDQAVLSIGRVEIPNHGSLPYAGTGFVVGKNVLMTNRHVAELFANGLGKQHLQFKAGQVADIDFRQEFGQQASDRLRVEKILMIHPWWDMALLQVSGLPESRIPLTLSTDDPASMLDQEVVVVGYPGYDPSGDQMYQNTQARIFRNTYYVKRLQPGLLKSRRPVRSFQRVVDAITHDCSTLGGNSGSAVIELKTGSVIGLHFAGAYLKANFAVPTIDLAMDSEVVDAGVNFKGTVTADDARYRPVWQSADNEHVLASNGRANQIVASSGSSAGIQMTDGTCELKINVPIELTVRIGNPIPVSSGTTGSTGEPVQKEEFLFGRKPSFSLQDLQRLFSASSMAATRFDWETVLSMAVASKVAYKQPATIKSLALKWGLSGCRFVQAGDTQCFIAATDDAVVVSFRGTENNLGDWLGNLTVFTTSRNYGKVHGGFLIGFDVVRRQLETLLQQFPERHILLTGHSLGGALALVAAAEWQDDFPIAGIYTFGQPAVGKGDFAPFINKHYDKKYFRIVNDDDIVPRIPPTFDHAGKLVHFNSSGQLESLATESANQETVMMDTAKFEDLRTLYQQDPEGNAGTESLIDATPEGLFPSVSDHSMDRYIEKVHDKFKEIS